jgi:hypothetical protein
VTQNLSRRASTARGTHWGRTDDIVKWRQVPPAGPGLLTGAPAGRRAAGPRLGLPRQSNPHSSSDCSSIARRRRAPPPRAAAARRCARRRALRVRPRSAGTKRAGTCRVASCRAGGRRAVGGPVRARPRRLPSPHGPQHVARALRIRSMRPQGPPHVPPGSAAGVLRGRRTCNRRS